MDNMEYINPDLSEDDILNIESEIYDMMNDYMESEILKMSSPKFHEDFIETISRTLFEYWLDCNICQEDHAEDIEELIESLSDIYFEMNNIPRRSTHYSVDAIHITESNIHFNKNMDSIEEQICTLQNLPQPKQRTPEWYEMRNNLITASNIWKCLSSQANINSIIYEKCEPLENTNYSRMSTNTESATHWGVKYEPLTVMVYEHMFQTKIEDFGCIQHQEHSFIGASPDGINTDPTNIEKYGRMLEIKNIFNREITGIPKEEYWIQCQVQMETCDLDECDFVETRFKEYETEDAFYQDASSEYKGVILYFIKRTLVNFENQTRQIAVPTTESNAPYYVYMPVDVSLDKECIHAWIQAKKEENKEDYVLFKTNYWYLDEISCVLIQRNRLWFENALPIFKQTWDLILKERVDGHQHRAPNRRIRSGSKEITIEKTENDNQQIRNMPVTNRICLVKLDDIVSSFAE